MKNDPDFVDYVCDQIDDNCEMSYRHMFGGTTLFIEITERALPAPKSRRKKPG